MPSDFRPIAPMGRGERRCTARGRQPPTIDRRWYGVQGHDGEGQMNTRPIGARTLVRGVVGAVAIAVVLAGTQVPAFAAAPTITSFNPTNGVPGTMVTINGTGFSGATSVAFNGTTTSFNVNGSGTQITTTVPVGATTGKISVTTPGGTDQSSSNFTVNGPAPTISSLAPSSSPPGTSLTINGSNFQGTTSVKFNGPAASSFNVNGGGTQK